MKSLCDFQNDYYYQYFIHTVNGILDGTERRRRIEIAEFKLGIHNPDSSIIDVDMLDNPTYKEWKHYDINQLSNIKDIGVNNEVTLL